MIVTLGDAGGMARALTRRIGGALGLTSELCRQPFLDRPVGGSAAGRLVAEAGCEIGDAGAAVAMAAIPEQQLADPGEVADRDPQPALRREQGAVGGERRHLPGAAPVHG